MIDEFDDENTEELRKIVGANIVGFNIDGTGYNAELMLDDGRRVQLNGYDHGLTVTVDGNPRI